MSKLNDVYTVIVPASLADLNAHVYTHVYGGGAGCSITLNGNAVTVAAGSRFDLRVNSVSGGSGCFLLGFNKDVVTGSPYLGSISS